jgi:hypothetical protein
LPVGRQQAERLVGGAGHQFVEVAAQCGHGGACRFGLCRAPFDFAGRRRGQQLFDGDGKFADSGQADDGQRAAGLMQIAARFAESAAVVERLRCAFEGEIDLVSDPGQRAGIEFEAHVEKTL